MFLTEREKAEDLARFKQAAKSIVERARKDSEYARQVLRDIGISDTSEHPLPTPQQKPTGPTTTRKKSKIKHPTSPKAHP